MSRNGHRLVITAPVHHGMMTARISTQSPMNAIKQVRKYLEQNPTRPASYFLADLVEALAEERPISLRQLYELDHEAFELAIELIKDWRLDRYYAARIRLFDVVLSGLPERDKRRAAPKAAG